MAELTSLQRNKLLRVFILFFDANNDGRIEWKDMSLFIEKVRLMLGWDQGDQNHTAATEALSFVWKGLQQHGDEDKDGKISRDEWCNMWAQCIKNNDQRHLPEWQKKYMDFLFDLNDTSGDGLVDKEEYSNVMVYFGLSQGNCEMAFNKFAPDGTVDRAGFQKLLIEYFYSDTRDDPGSDVFGILPNDDDLERMANYHDDSSGEDD